MDDYKKVITSMINVSEEEIEELSRKLKITKIKKNHLINNENSIPNEIYFINQGLVRLYVIDNYGKEHTMHFALEKQFVADYSNFLLKQNAKNILETLEDTELVVISRSTLEWCYNNLKEGEKLGRIIAEYYFVHHTERIQNLLLKTPKERYDLITSIFPKIHNRVPQHMIASYLGITPVHLSRIKKLNLSNLL